MADRFFAFHAAFVAHSLMHQLLEESCCVGDLHHSLLGGWLLLKMGVEDEPFPSLL
jgi:hypothetical protein